MKKYNYQLTDKQKETLEKMKPGKQYTAKDLGCHFKTLEALGNHNLVVSDNWKIDSNTNWSETVKWKLRETK